MPRRDQDDDSASSLPDESSISSSAGTSADDRDDDDDEVANGDDETSVTTAGQQAQYDVGLTKLRVSREQQLRRLLSQRRLGAAQALPKGQGFFATQHFLSDDDAVLLMTFSNSACFESLLSSVAAGPSMQQLAGMIDQLLSAANPYFDYGYHMPIDTIETNRSTEAFAQPVVAGHFHRWAAETQPIKRQKIDAGSTTGAAGHSKAKKKGDSATGDSAAALQTSGSASLGLVAQSRQAWDAHLRATLHREGETVESFRQRRGASSYLEKKQFERSANWNEYQRELNIQERQRDLEKTRALRRGEAEHGQ